MREIKFRAWHEGFEIGRGLSKRVEPPQMLYDEKPGDCLLWKQGQNITAIMQFTGLRDKNGKEIYEGDICRDEDGLGVIYWEKDCWMYGFVLFDSSYKSDGYMLREMADDCEVIGNIYENPEPLEVSHDTKI